MLRWQICEGWVEDGGRIKKGKVWSGRELREIALLVGCDGG